MSTRRNLNCLAQYMRPFMMYLCLPDHPIPWALKVAGLSPWSYSSPEHHPSKTSLTSPQGYSNLSPPNTMQLSHVLKVILFMSVFAADCMCLVKKKMLFESICWMTAQINEWVEKRTNTEKNCKEIPPDVSVTHDSGLLTWHSTEWKLLP